MPTPHAISPQSEANRGEKRSTKNSASRRKKFRDSVRSLKWTMSLIAIWPGLPDKIPLHILWLFYLIFFNLLWLVSYAGDVFFRQTFEGIIAGLGQGVAVMVIAVKYAFFKGQMKPLKWVLECMEADWENLEIHVDKEPNGDEIITEAEKIMSRHTRTPRIFFAVYTIVTGLCWTLFIASSAIRQSTASKQPQAYPEFPMRSWYPFATNYSPMYEIVLISETVSGFGVVIAHTSIDGLLITIIFHLCGQFEILSYRIAEFRSEKRTMRNMNAKIESIVKRHLEIINLGSALQNSFSHILLVQLLGGTVHICLASFSFIQQMLQALKLNNAVNLITFGLLLSMTLQQIFIYSLAGDYLTSQSESIAVAAYEAKWYDMPTSISKSLMLVMAEGERPMTLSAGKIYQMSLVNFSQLLKSSVSYLSVLRAMNR